MASTHPTGSIVTVGSWPGVNSKPRPPLASAGSASLGGRHSWIASTSSEPIADSGRYTYKKGGLLVATAAQAPEPTTQPSQRDTTTAQTGAAASGHARAGAATGPKRFVYQNGMLVVPQPPPAPPTAGHRRRKCQRYIKGVLYSIDVSPSSPQPPTIWSLPTELLCMQGFGMPPRRTGRARLPTPATRYTMVPW